MLDTILKASLLFLSITVFWFSSQSTARTIHVRNVFDYIADFNLNGRPFSFPGLFFTEMP